MQTRQPSHSLDELPLRFVGVGPPTRSPPCVSSVPEAGEGILAFLMRIGWIDGGVLHFPLETSGAAAAPTELKSRENREECQGEGRNPHQPPSPHAVQYN